MILCAWSEAEVYRNVHPAMGKVLELLRSGEAERWEQGKHELDGERLLAIAAVEQGRGLEKGRLEGHRKYIDVQTVIEGMDVIGWRNTADCGQVAEAYDAERDVGFWSDRPTHWFDLSPRFLCVFHPSDAHAPLSGAGPVRKIVFKLAVDWE